MDWYAKRCAQKFAAFMRASQGSIAEDLSTFHCGPAGERSKHDERSTKCWCEPKVFQPCDHCQTIPDTDCCVCDGLGMVDPYTKDLGLIVIHARVKRGSLHAPPGFPSLNETNHEGK